MVNMSNYQTPVGTFITSPQAQIPTHAQSMSPQSAAPSAVPVQQTRSQMSTNNFQQYVVEKLNAMDKRLSKLDTIETQLLEVTRQISQIDTRVVPGNSITWIEQET